MLLKEHLVTREREIHHHLSICHGSRTNLSGRYVDDPAQPHEAVQEDGRVVHVGGEAQPGSQEAVLAIPVP